MPAPRAPLPDSLARVPFTAAQAAREGVSPKTLRGPSVRRLWYGVYLAADVDVTLAVRVRAALLVLPPGTVASGVTALQLLGLDLGSAEPLRFVSTAPHQVRRAGLTVTRVAALPPHRDGRTLGAYAFVQAAAQLDLVDLVAAGDWLVRRKGVATAGLTQAAGDPRIRVPAGTRRAVGLVRERVDSVRETRLRLVLVLAGLPEPEVNIGLGTQEWFIGTPDLVYQTWRVLLEYEGDQHRTDKRQWGIDLSRYEEFTADGWTVIRVNAEQLRPPRSVVRRTYEAIRKGGYTGPEPRFDREWARLFG